MASARPPLTSATLFLLGVAAGVLPLEAASAQSGNDPSENETSEYADDEIVVSALKREQRLQEVPSPISVIGGGQLEAAGIDNLVDITRVTTGLVYNKNGAFAQPTIRGIGTRSSGAGDSSNVAVYVDGVYLSAQQGGFTDFNNIDRVEVLKGPQGTLFGRNATGGAISIVTRTPKFDPAIEGTLAYASYSRVTGKLYATAGLSETVAMDVALLFDKDDGFTRDILSNARLRQVNNRGVRSKLRWEASDSTSITVAGDYGRYRSNQGFAYTPLNRNAATLRTEPATAIAGVARDEVALSFVPVVSAKQYGGSLTIEHDDGGIAFTSISSYRKVDAYDELDTDATQLDRTRLQIVAPTETITQEIFAASPDQGLFTWVGGLFFLTETADRDPTRTTVRTAAGVTSQSDTTASSKTLALAPYAEVTLNASEQLKIIGGVRYSYEQKKLRNGRNGIPQVDATADFRNLDYRATLQYQPDRDLNLYLTRSTGFKSGVFNASAFDGIPVRPEKVRAWELGVKSTLGGVAVNADVFQYDYDDIQINRSVNPLTGQTLLQNAASARIRGAELEIQGQLGGGLRANAGVTYLDGRYRNFPDASVLTPIPGGGNASVSFNANGLPTMRTPEWTIVLGLNYGTDLFGGTLDIGGTAYHSSQFSWEPSNRVRQPAYTLFQAQMSWTAPGDRYSIAIYGENLSNDTYYENVAISSGGDFATYAAPRRVGVRLGFRL